MRKLQWRHLVFWFFALTAFVFLQSGCGIVSLMGTERESEKKIPAEYDLTNHKDRKILVLVDQPAWLNAQVNLRYYLTNAVCEYLTAKIEIRPEYLVPYGELSEFRSDRSDFSLLPPVEVGKALDAEMVLLVMVEDYQLSELPEAGYYNGSLSARAVLFDTAAGEKLWPGEEKGKSIKVGFEIEQYGQEVAVKRLVSACAHCIVRYLYDCPKNKFKIADDRSDIGWKAWGK